MFFGARATETAVQREVIRQFLHLRSAIVMGSSEERSVSGCGCDPRIAEGISMTLPEVTAEYSCEICAAGSLSAACSAKVTEAAISGAEFGELFFFLFVATAEI